MVGKNAPDADDGPGGNEARVNIDRIARIRPALDLFDAVRKWASPV